MTTAETTKTTAATTTTTTTTTATLPTAAEIRISDEYENFVTAPLSDEDFRALVDSIRDGRQEVAGLVNQDGVILDGHNRYKACAQLGIPFRYEVKHCKNKAEEILTIVEANGNRRHMTPFQRAELALRAKSELEKLAKENMSLGGKGVRIQTPLGRVDDKIAKLAHTSRDMIYKASQVIEAAEKTPNKRLWEDCDGRYRGKEGPTYAELLRDARQDKLKSSKVCSLIKRDKDILAKRAELEVSARSRGLPDKVTLLNVDCTKLEDIPQLQDNSVDLIVTDPPYMKEYLYLYEGLAKLASQKLKPGGSLVFNYGNHLETEIHKIFAKYDNLTWWWRFCVFHEGAHNSRVHAKGVRVSWKPMMWFVKKGRKRLTSYDINDFIKSTKPDKTQHPWAQSSTEAEYLVKYLTESEDSLVVDPFLGSGAFAIPAIQLRRYFIGLEIDKDTFEQAKNYLKMEAAST